MKNLLLNMRSFRCNYLYYFKSYTYKEFIESEREYEIEYLYTSFNLFYNFVNKTKKYSIKFIKIYYSILCLIKLSYTFHFVYGKVKAISYLSRKKTYKEKIINNKIYNYFPTFVLYY